MEFEEVIIITEEWDIHYKKLLHACNRIGSKCKMLSLESPDGLDLLLRYGTRNYMAKIPLVLIKRGNSIAKIEVEELLDQIAKDQ